MSENIEKIYHSWDNYSDDIIDICDYIDKKDIKPYFVSIYRGSIPMGVHLSNIYGTPLSIINYQTRSGKTDTPQWLINLLPETNAAPYTIIVLDDIYDTGATLKSVKTLLKDYKVDVLYTTIYDNISAEKVSGAEDLNIVSLRRSKGEWIVFPWEEK